VTGPLIHMLTQSGGPARDRERSLAAGRLAVSGITTVCGDRRIDARAPHEREYLPRIGRELQLEKFLPHLLLRAAEDRDVGRETERPRDHRRAKAQHLVDSLENLGPAAQYIAEIDQPVSRLEPRGERIVKRGEPIG